MGRQYTIEHYLERLARIREAVPGITISTDVIVGFCGETEAQFEATLRLLETVRYDQVFAAAYSPRPGTPATQLADDVPADVKRRRLNELLALQEGIGLERNEAWLGREVEVLVDAVAPPRSARPRGRDDARAPADGRDGVRPDPREQARPPRRRRRTWSGARSTVRIDHAGPYALRGALVAGVSDAPPLARHRGRDRDRQDRPRDRARRGAAAAGGPPRSSRPTRARSTAASTSARPR